MLTVVYKIVSDCPEYVRDRPADYLPRYLSLYPKRFPWEFATMGYLRWNLRTVDVHQFVVTGRYWKRARAMPTSNIITRLIAFFSGKIRSLSMKCCCMSRWILALFLLLSCSKHFALLLEQSTSRKKRHQRASDTFPNRCTGGAPQSDHSHQAAALHCRVSTRLVQLPAALYVCIAYRCLSLYQIYAFQLGSLSALSWMENVYHSTDLQTSLITTTLLLPLRAQIVHQITTVGK